MASIIGSPWLALYCKMRRMLKKRGVSRRRWACTLCRRRARWKCVRCLRSYYCSRECQNVDWHLQHKHLCYKPVRLAQSTMLYLPPVLYLLYPSLRDDARGTVVLYALVLPALFHLISSKIVGPVLSIVKAVFNKDFRGRMAELVTVVATVAGCILAKGIVSILFESSSSDRAVAVECKLGGKSHSGFRVAVWLASVLSNRTGRSISVEGGVFERCGRDLEVVAFGFALCVLLELATTILNKMVERRRRRRRDVAGEVGVLRRAAVFDDRNRRRLAGRAALMENRQGQHLHAD